MERYQRRVYNVCLRLVGQPADAADVTQEVFLRIYTRLDGFRGEAPFRTWVYRITVNTCRDELRRRRRRPAPVEDQPAHVVAAAVTGSTRQDDDPARTVVGREVQATIQAALNQLPESFRAAVVLRDVQGLTYEEVAEVLGVSVGTVKSRIHRGRLLLRDRLAAAGLLGDPKEGRGTR